MNCLLFRIVACCLLMFSCIFPCSAEENFILVDGRTSEILMEKGLYIDERTTPACSFNIALSLMGYNEGVLQDTITPVWDFHEGYDDGSESWKTFQSPQSWMSRSCVWYSKILALQLGLKTMQSYLGSFEYGNQDLSIGLAKPGPMAPPWVSSSLKISPREQITFIQKMILGKLSVSIYAIQMTRAILFKEELPDQWNLYGKTGLGTVTQGDKDLKARWFVGWIEKGDLFYPFAYYLQKEEMDVTQTVPRVKQLLVESNLMNLSAGNMLH